MILGDGLWLPEDYRIPARCPLQGVPGNRSAEALWAIIDIHHVGEHPRYKPRDVTGDDRDETFCNVYVSDITAALGCPVPLGMLANKQIEWLERRSDWWTVDADKAAQFAVVGMPVVACWQNPEATRSGHVGVLVPPPFERSGIWIAQAGALCSSRMTLTAGFGARAVTFKAHH